MNLDASQKILEDKVIADEGAWGVPHIFGNSQARTMIGNGNPFVEVNINFLQHEQKSLGEVGTRVFRRHGVMDFSAYVPVDSGTREQNRIHQVILDSFEGRTITGIVFKEATHRTLGVVNGWTLESLRLKFYFNIMER